MLAGETLTLNCTWSGRDVIGPVRWLKGWGSENKTIYDQRKHLSFPRVMRTVNESNSDFTIRIRNVTPEDTGTYYCVKFCKKDSGEDVVFAHGKGTEVSVQGECSPAGRCSQGPIPPSPPCPQLGPALPRTHPSVLLCFCLPRENSGSWNGGCSCSALLPPPPRPLRRPLRVQEEAPRRGGQPVPGQDSGHGQLLFCPCAVLCRDPQHPQVCTQRLFLLHP